MKTKDWPLPLEEMFHNYGKLSEYDYPARAKHGESNGDGHAREIWNHRKKIKYVSRKVLIIAQGIVKNGTIRPETFR